MSSRVPLLLLVAATSLMAVLYLGRRRRRSPEPTQEEPGTKRRRVEEPASPRSVLDGVEEPAVPPSVLDNAEQRTRITHREYTFASTGERLPYALFVPPQLQEPAPLLLCLHGLDYSYDSLLSDALLDAASAASMIVVAPLGYTRTAWYGAPNLLARGNVTVDGRRSEADVLEVLALVRREFKIGKVYAYGWSMGGAGALHLALKHRILAALALVAPAIGIPGRIEPFTTRERLATIADVPAIVFQGRWDAPVPVEQTRRLVADMRGAGMQARYVERPDEGHELPSAATAREVVEFLAACASA